VQCKQDQQDKPKKCQCTPEYDYSYRPSGGDFQDFAFKSHRLRRQHLYFALGVLQIAGIFGYKRRKQSI
jgi:hypothetical protein